MVATKEIKEKDIKTPVFLLPPDVDLVIQSGPLSEEHERVVLAFIKKSKANRKRRERYAAKKEKHTPSV